MSLTDDIKKLASDARLHESGSNIYGFFDDLEALLAHRTCRHCRWWDGESEYHANRRLCLHDKMEADYCPAGDDAMWCEWTESGGLTPGPDFSCKHWEQKP